MSYQLVKASRLPYKSLRGYSTKEISKMLKVGDCILCEIEEGGEEYKRMKVKILTIAWDDMFPIKVDKRLHSPNNLRLHCNEIIGVYK